MLLLLTLGTGEIKQTDFKFAIAKYDVSHISLIYRDWAFSALKGGQSFAHNLFEVGCWTKSSKQTNRASKVDLDV